MSTYMASQTEGRICLFGAPFDSTTSYRPGSRFAPGAIREASYGLETFSPALNGDLEDCAFMDLGDLELPFGDPTPALAMIEATAAEILAAGRIPFLLGGEHLVSLGVIRALKTLYPDLLIIHLDAHADLRDDYLGQRLSHTTVMRRALDLLGEGSLMQIGIRSCTRQEFGLVQELRVLPQEIAARAAGRPCYVSCDLDIMDPAFFPGTGTPEPGGCSYAELVSILTGIMATQRVVGLDVVELAPQLDASGVSAVVAAKVVRECLISLGQVLNNF